jgi:UTP-glucose-1-phosphate uridylyltransferase
LSGSFLATIGVREVPDITRYANVSFSPDYLLVDIIEKPTPESALGKWAKMGAYILSPDLIAEGRAFFRDSKGEIATTAAFANLCRTERPARCVIYSGAYLDIGTLGAYVELLSKKSINSE